MIFWSSWWSTADDWNVGTSDWRTEKESCSNEDGYENKMDGNENQWYGKDDRAEEKNYSWYSTGSGNDQTRQISPKEKQYWNLLMSRFFTWISNIISNIIRINGSKS